MKSDNIIKVVELFSGVGGFRIGLEGWKGKSASSGFKKSLKSPYKVIWSNQWEPSTKSQHASDVYEKVFGKAGHSNEDISKVKTSDIPDHDLLVGGFPCQDYSVARTLNQSAGLEGKKGVLWWQIHRILTEKKKKPTYLLLENVDRLLKSPVKQRGRDFAIMLASLSDLGYIVEWRVINAADYGMPQRRKRVFFLAYHKDTAISKKIRKLKDPNQWILDIGVFANSFEVQKSALKNQNYFTIEGDLASISKSFNAVKGSVSPFNNSGVMIDRKVFTVETKPNFDGDPKCLADILIPEDMVPKEFFIKKLDIEKWEYLKNSKNEIRINKATGFTYKYTEGGMAFPDPIDKPSRTIITGEGGASASRFKHVVRTKSGKLRRLTPIELERLNMFPDNHTSNASDIKRAFFMGNALVTGVIERIGIELSKKI
jgi:DNA (cytosine-5)-methyltransferase 1